jgi:hypothetical protein
MLSQLASQLDRLAQPGVTVETFLSPRTPYTCQDCENFVSLLHSAVEEELRQMPTSI